LAEGCFLVIRSSGFFWGFSGVRPGCSKVGFRFGFDRWLIFVGLVGFDPFGWFDLGQLLLELLVVRLERTILGLRGKIL